MKLSAQFTTSMIPAHHWFIGTTVAESVNDVFDEDATADDVEDMEDYNVFVHSNKDSKGSGAPLAFASFCDDYPNREWTIFHM